MALFQKSVLNNYLDNQDRQFIQRQYQLFKTYFLNPTIQNNILASKEEEFQEGFLRELFVKILGYTISPEPDFNLRTELKNQKDSKKADGAIIDNENVLAVIELKSTATTDLNKIEIQAFNYKNNQKDCRYIITSNFQKLRFYIDDAIEYLEWDLFKLDNEQFRLLFLCLHKKNIFINLPATIKAESITEEENVTKKLYDEYSSFRKELFNNIAEKNAEFDKLLLFKKTQKLLDRFLFLFFAEDRNLVPPNSVRLILGQWTELKERFDEYHPLYDRFKKYFSYLNDGFIGKQHDIFAYNGGLFATDEILDAINIDDNILYNATLSLSRYDYNSDVDVNILGHIFEHALTEIEELETAIIAGEEPSVNTSKRKKDGIFYTPKYITKYIVENTIGKLCAIKKEEFGIVEEDYVRGKRNIKTQKPLLKKLYEYKEWLLNITIVDPACGSGAFLNQALDFLIYEHNNIAYLESILTRRTFADESIKLIEYSVDAHILENNLFGVDINEESVEIAKLGLWLRTARKGRKLTSLSNNIKCGNSLIDSPTVAGEKAFNWENEFPQIFKKRGFDIVIGNPPYGAKFSEAEKSLIVKFKTYKYKFESYLYFFEKGAEILKGGGYLGYITPELWLTLENCEPLRKFIYEETFLTEINIVGENVFSDAVVNTVITILNKGRKRDSFAIRHKEGNIEYTYAKWKSSRSLSIDYRVNDNTSEIIAKIEDNSFELKRFGEVIQGITPYDKYRGQDAQLIKSRGYHFDHEKDDTCGHWLSGEDINRYALDWSSEWLSYGEWLAAPRESRFFEGNRLLFREIPGRNRRIQAVFTNEKSYYGHSITPFILNDRSDTQSLYALLCIVNSKILSWYGNAKLPNFGKEIFPKLNPQDIKLLPIHKNWENYKESFTAHGEIMLRKNYDLKERGSQFNKLLISRFPSIRINSKLDVWYILSFESLMGELKKQKIKLSLQDTSEWLQYFEIEKQKVLSIIYEIDKTDKEIDRIVYKLYGLTEEEIKIVEEKL